PTLHSQRGREPSPDLALQLGPKIVFLADVLWHDPAGAFRLWAVVGGLHPVEPALAALFVGYGARDGGAGHHRRLHYSRVYGDGYGARRLHFDYPRRGVSRMGENPPPALVRAGQERDDRTGMIRSRWDQRIQRADELAAAHPFAAEVLQFY